VRGTLEIGFQENTMSQTLFVFCFSIKWLIVSLAFSILFGCKSVASIDLDISRASTISIPFFVIFCLILALFGFANNNIKIDKIDNSKNTLR